MMNLKEQFFGVEIEFTGITRKTAGEVVANHFGTTRRYLGGGYHTHEINDQQGRTWKIVYDSSIRTSGSDEMKCELVTPKLQYNDLKTLGEIICKIREKGAVVNDSCGIHVHVDAANHDAHSLKNLMYIMRSKEDMLFKALNILPDRYCYCKKVDEPTFRKLRATSNVDMDKLCDIWYNGSTLQRYNHYSQTRYHALNLHDVWYRGTVEFRMFNSSLFAREIRAYVTLALALSAYAINSKRAICKKQWFGINEKQMFEHWLIRIGLKTNEFYNVRQHLTKHLQNNMSNIA